MLKFLERLNPKGPQAERVIIFLCYSVFIIYAFCVFDTHFQGRAPEDKIYFSYTASVAEDADLNISNQLFKKGDSFEVSRTLNYPEFRNHGGIIFWLPFYSYGKLLFLLNNHGYHKEEVVKAAMAMSTVILGSLAVLLTFLLARSFFSLSLSFVSVIFIIFGTPFCYYMLFEAGNAQVLSALLSVLLIYFLFFSKLIKIKDMLILGVFFSICLTVRIDLWFQIVLIILVLGLRVTRKEIGFTRLGWFFLGLVPGCGLKLINDYIKYGELRIGELNIINLRSFYFLEQLFSPYHGYVYVSPIILICLLGFIIVCKDLVSKRAPRDGDANKRAFIFLLGVTVMVKIFIISFRYGWESFKQLLTDLPAFVLLFCAALRAFKGRFRYAIILLSVAFVIWDFAVIGEYLHGDDFKYITNHTFAPLCRSLIDIRYIVYPLLAFKGMLLKLCFLMPLLFLSGATAYYCIAVVSGPSFHLDRQNSDIKKKNVTSLLTKLSMVLLAFYAGITLLNIVFNKKNVVWLKQNSFFVNSVVIPARYFEWMENDKALRKTVLYFSRRGDTKRLKEAQELRKKHWDTLEPSLKIHIPEI